MARVFDGVDDLIRNAAVATGATDNFTLGLWVRFANFTGGQDNILFNGDSGANGWGLYYVSGGLSALYGGVAVFGGAAYSTADTWAHLVLRRSGGTGQIFLGGATFGSSWANAPSAPSAGTTGGFTLGSQTQADNDNLPKTAAEAFCYDVALDAAEIAALAKGFSPRLIRPASLLLHWPLGGRNSPENNTVGTQTGTVTGAAYAAHPRIIMPRRRGIIGVPAAAPGGANANYLSLLGVG